MKINPMIVFRDEGEDGGILFDPDTGAAFGLNLTAKFIWQGLSEGLEPDQIFNRMRDSFEHIPDEARADMDTFLEALTRQGFLSAE